MYYLKKILNYVQLYTLYVPVLYNVYIDTDLEDIFYTVIMMLFILIRYTYLVK